MVARMGFGLIAPSKAFVVMVKDDQVGNHYYQSGVQFTSLNHYGTLKVK
jgi:hypothetical protein